MIFLRVAVLTQQAAAERATTPKLYGQDVPATSDFIYLGIFFDHKGINSFASRPSSGAAPSSSREDRRRSPASCKPCLLFAWGIAADPRPAVRFAGRADHAANGDHRHAGGADPDPGLLQCRSCLLGKPPPWRRVARGGPVGTDRGLQFLRAGGGDGDCPVRLSVGPALATVVGVLIEVPVMLSVVKIVRTSRGWYERGVTA